MKRAEQVLLVYAAAIVGLHLFGALAPGPFNWGFHFFGFLPRGLLIGFGLLAVLAFLPPVRTGLVRLLNPLARGLEGSGARVVAGVCIAAFVVAFWFLRQRVFLLSDGQLLIRSVMQGMVAFTADTLDATIQLFAHHWFGLLVPGASQTASFRIVSIGCGVIWLTALYALIGRLTPAGWGRLLLGGLVSLAGISRFFYGYAETGPILAAAVAVYFWTATRYLATGKGLVAATLAFLFVGAMHITGLLMFPSYFLLLTAWAGRDRRRWLGAVGLLLLPVAGYVAYLLARGGTPESVWAAYAPFFGKFIPLAGTLSAKQPYTQLSVWRWLDFLNLQVLLGPFAVLAVAALLASGAFKAPAGFPPALVAIRRFLIWAMLPFLALSLIFLPELGGARDWDLLASVALPAILLVGLTLLGTREKPAMLAGTTVTLLAVSLFQVVGWVVIDARPADSLRRFETLFRADAPVSRFARSYALEELANYHLEQNNPRAAIPLLEEATRVDPANSKSAGSLGALYIDSGRLAEALPLMRRAARLRPDVAQNQYNLAGALARNGKLDSAVVAYAESIRLNSRFMQAYQNMGIVLAAQGRRAEADSIWRTGLKQFPDEVGFYNNLGTNEESMGQQERAVETYRTALKLRPDDGNVIFNLARVLQRMNRLTEAQPLLERLVQAEPQNGEASVNLGLIYEQQGREDDAMKAYGHAMAVNTKLPPAYLNLARLMVGRKDEAGAIQVLETFLENDPDNAKKVGVEQFLLNLRHQAAADSAR